MRTLLAAFILAAPALASAQPVGEPDDRPDPASNDVAHDVPRLVPPWNADDPETRRLILPPYYSETHGQSGMRAFFPFYFNHWSPGFHATLLGPYYDREGGPGTRTRVLFPFYWHYERTGWDLLVLPPAYTLSASNGWDAGVPPLFMAGRTDDDQYLLIPPLLLADFRDADSSLTIFGPYYSRTRPDYDGWGIVPIHFEADDEGHVYDVWFPLYWKFADVEEGLSTTVLGPTYWRHGPGWSSYGLAPLVFGAGGTTQGGTDWSRLTVLPLFHTASRGDDAFRLATPLFLWDRTPDSTLLVLPFYQRYRGEISVDAVAPIFWHWQRETTGLDSWLVPPIYHSTGPAHRSEVIFPALWYLHDYERSRTIGLWPLFVHHYNWPERYRALWLFPTIHYETDPTSWMFNVHPLLYLGASETKNHQVFFPLFWRFQDREGPDTVLFPLYWDFEDTPRNERDIVGFPLFWRFRTQRDVTQVIGNTLYTRRRCEREGEGQGWTFHFLPLFAFGEPCPDDTYFSLLYGMLGYRSAGRHRRMDLFWIPIDLGSEE